MPLFLDIKKKLKTRTERVKHVDFHPTETWILSALYSGSVTVYDYKTGNLIKTIEASKLPTRCAKFIARHSWIASAGDDMNIRIFNYNTLEKVKVFEAHTDYIRHIAIHPVHSYLLSSSDDMTIRLFDWEKQWTQLFCYEGHSHYVMMCVWSPKDQHIFASASLDRSIKVWSVQSEKDKSSATPTVIFTPHFSLLGHEKGVNCLDYSPSGERPYLVSGSDDKTVRIWDYQTRQCLHILTSHAKNVNAVLFHKHLPLILSGSEDGALNIWHSTMYRLEMSVNNNMKRLWSIDVLKSNNVVALGYDEGTLVCTFGNDIPVASMHNGKIIFNKNNEIQSANLKLLDISVYEDGERIPLPIKDLGPADIFAQKISHNPNGRFIVVCGDGEYIIYTAQALRSKSYGKALDFVWSFDGGYAIRSVKQNKIIIYKNFTECLNFIPSFSVDELFGGVLLALKSNEFICFYDWEECRFIRRVEVTGVRNVLWNESHEFVALICETNFFVLQYDKNSVAAAATANVAQDDVGIEIAFELVQEINEKVESGIWISNSFVYVTSELRLQLYTSGYTDTIAYLDRLIYILNYSADQNRLFLIDKELSVVSYSLHLALLEYLNAVSHKDFEKAAVHFRGIPTNTYNKLAKFLDHLGHKEFALDVTRDPDHQFELAIQLGKLQKCVDIISQSEEEYSKTKSNALSAGFASTALSSSSSCYSTTLTQTALKQNITSYWKRLADLALTTGRIDLSKLGYTKANDYNGLLLLYSSIGDEEGLKYVALKTKECGQTNISFLCFYLLNDLDNCIQVLLDVGNYSEAAIFARSYAPSKIKNIMPLWKNQLLAVNESISEALYDPSKNPEMFPNFEISIIGEEIVRKRMKEFGLRESSEYLQMKDILEINLVNEIQLHGKEEVENVLLSNVNASSNQLDLLNNDYLPLRSASIAISSVCNSMDKNSVIESSQPMNSISVYNENGSNSTNDVSINHSNKILISSSNSYNFSSESSVPSFSNKLNQKTPAYPFDELHSVGNALSNNHLPYDSNLPHISDSVYIKYDSQLDKLPLNSSLHSNNEKSYLDYFEVDPSYEKEIISDVLLPHSLDGVNSANNESNVINTFLNDEWQSVHTHSSPSSTANVPPESNTPKPEVANESAEGKK